MVADLQKAVQFLSTGTISSTIHIDPYVVLESSSQVADWFIEAAQAGDSKLQLSLDSEWHGKDSEDPNAYLRTMQISTAQGSRTAVIRFFPTNSLENPVDPTKQYPGCADLREVMSIIQMFLDNVPGSSVFGQNIIADGVWFMKYGLDIREYTVYDTMLSEHLIDNRGPLT